MLNTVPSQRIFDTRTHKAPVGGGKTINVLVLGVGGVPAAGVSAVMLNVTAINESTTGYLTLYPDGIARPTVSSLNYRHAVTIANQALVPVGPSGIISLYNSAGSTDVAIDVEGWVGISPAGAGGETTTATPVRVLDTRSTTGNNEGTLTNGKAVTLPVAGTNGIPAGISAVYANVTAVPAAGSAGYLTAYPSDATSAPVVSTVNFVTGVATANLALLQVSASGSITIANHSPSANAVIDIVGWVSGGDPTGDAGTQPLSPARILDTRNVSGHHDPIAGGGAAVVKVLGAGGVPLTGVAAVVVHITAINPTNPATYLTVLANGYPKPVTSVVNPVPGATSNTAIVPVGPTGSINVYNYSGTIDATVDVQGWIAAPVLTVTPPSPAALGAGATLTSADGELAQQILDNANKYALTTWWTTVYPALVGSNLTSAAQISPDDVADLSGPVAPSVTGSAVDVRDATRRLSMEAYSLATSISTGEYNATLTGVPLSTAQSRTVTIIDATVAEHLTEKPAGWGETSQSMFDAALLGTAAWMLWDHLSPAVQGEVAKMVYFEAEWGMDRPIGFYANEAGTVLSPGDTWADQDSWYPMAAQLATVMMPANAHVALWQNTVVRDAIDAWSQSSDDTSATVVNGASLQAWIAGRGANVNGNGSVWNHGRIAPDYSTLIYQNMQDALLNSLAGQATPQAVTALTGNVYKSYTSAVWTSPPYDAPNDSTVYVKGTKTIYWPTLCDWGDEEELPYALADAETDAFNAGTTVGTTTNVQYEMLHGQAELALQDEAGHTDGHTYDGTLSNAPANLAVSYIYVGREEQMGQEAAQLYLTDYIRDHSLSSFTSNSYWLAP
jgi:hypothetical protein